MRLRTLIELLAALILTFAALAAFPKMARTTGMKADNAYARATIVEAKRGVYLRLNTLEAKRTGLVAMQQTLPDAQLGLIHHILMSDANPPLRIGWYPELRRQSSTGSV